MGILSRVLEVLDDVFVAVLARYRRRPAYSFDRAWRAAEYQFSSYIALPVVALVVLLFMAYWPAQRPPDETARRTAAVVAVCVVLAVQWALARRFRRQLRNPPDVPPVELPSDTRRVRLFRLACIGVMAIGIGLFSASGAGLL